MKHFYVVGFTLLFGLVGSASAWPGPSRVEPMDPFTLKSVLDTSSKKKFLSGAQEVFINLGD